MIQSCSSESLTVELFRFMAGERGQGVSCCEFDCFFLATVFMCMQHAFDMRCLHKMLPNTVRITTMDYTMANFGKPRVWLIG